MTTSWIKTNKSANPTWSKSSKSLMDSFILLENGGYMLLESGFKIILEQSIPSAPTWTKLTKS